MWYQRVRDHADPMWHEAKDFVEELWSEAWPYLDDNLPDAAPHRFFARYWELYLTVALLRGTLPLVPRSARSLASGGPDLELATTPRIFVEAVCATTGTGADAVPNRVGSGATAALQHGVVLRMRNAIEEKYRKFQDYCIKGIVQPGDACVIALNTGQIFAAKFSGSLPNEVRAVLPFGDPVVQINLTTKAATFGGFTHRPAILKQSGASVSTTVFCDGAHRGLSALLSSKVDLVNRPERLGQGAVGADFTFIHNPQATTGVPRGMFPYWREYWVDGEWVLHTEDGIRVQ